MTTKLEFFHLYLTKEMFNSIATHTNSSAAKKISSRGYSTYTNRTGAWDETSAEEIEKLIALLIYFGIVRVDSDVEMYWSTKTFDHGLWARKILSRTRFKALMAFLHVVDPVSETPGNKLRKVEEFINVYKERCKLLYQPPQNVAVDERMVKSRHRSGIRQHRKDKPTKWGIKLWVLEDSSNGYTCDFEVYIGKAVSECLEHGLAYDVVMKLVEPLFDQGYHVFFDNFYTSPKLVRDLLSHGTPSVGTVRLNKREIPAGLLNVNEWAKKEKRGSMRWVRKSKVLALQWTENKPVSLLTTIDSANDMVKTTRRTKKGKFQRKEVQNTYAIHRYNKYMNAVDRSDQMLSCHNIARKCYRWWKTLFFHLVDMAIVNSFILFQKHREENPDEIGLE